MVFIIFDIELVFLYPWAVIFRHLKLFGLVEMGVFLATVVVAFAYVLSVGALDWGPARKLGEFAGRPILRAKTWPPPPRPSGPDQTSEAA
jgi:NADH-quinone oxidoreductase subunit A